jgi:hypothetical protein
MSENSEIYDRLGSVESTAGNLQARVAHVEETLRGHGAKLDAIITAVSGHRSFDPLTVMKFISLALLIMSAGAAAITYVAASINAPQLAVLEHKMDVLRSSGRWIIRPDDERAR